MLRKSFFLVFFWKHFAKKTRFNFTERTPKSWIYGQKSQLYNVELANVNFYYFKMQTFHCH